MAPLLYIAPLLPANVLQFSFHQAIFSFLHLLSDEIVIRWFKKPPFNSFKEAN